MHWRGESGRECDRNETVCPPGEKAMRYFKSAAISSSVKANVHDPEHGIVNQWLQRDRKSGASSSVDPVIPIKGARVAAI